MALAVEKKSFGVLKAAFSCVEMRHLAARTLGAEGLAFRRLSLAACDSPQNISHSHVGI